MVCSEVRKCSYNITANHVSHTLYRMSTQFFWFYYAYVFHKTGHRHWFSDLLHLSLFQQVDLFTISTLVPFVLNINLIEFELQY